MDKDRSEEIMALYAEVKRLKNENENIIVKPLEDDLKYYNTEQIRRMFYE